MGYLLRNSTKNFFLVGFSFFKIKQWIYGFSFVSYKDWPQIPPLNFSTTCFTSRCNVIFFNGRYLMLNSFAEYIARKTNDRYERCVNNIYFFIKKIDNEAVLLDSHSMYQPMDLWIVPLCVTKMALMISYRPWSLLQHVSHLDVTSFSTMNDLMELSILKNMKLRLFIPNFAKFMFRVGTRIITHTLYLLLRRKLWKKYE